MDEQEEGWKNKLYQKLLIGQHWNVSEKCLESGGKILFRKK